MIDPTRIIIEPIITEKATEATSNENRYTFKVAKTANANEIRDAIAKRFDVDVKSVSTINVKPKAKTNRRRGASGFKPGYKKAIIRVGDGQSIDLA